MSYTPGPWRACNGAECPCLTVSCGDHPIAKITNGDWGDDFASIRLVGPSVDLKAEAFMDQLTYGHINIETAKANARLIAAAPDLYEALTQALQRMKDWRDGKYPMSDAAIAHAESAIAKADGAATEGLITSGADQPGTAAIVPNQQDGDKA